MVSTEIRDRAACCGIVIRSFARRGSLFVGPLHEFRVRHVVDGPHLESGILVNLGQSLVAWKCPAGPSQELDSLIMHRICLNVDCVSLAVCGLHRHIAEAFA